MNFFMCSGDILIIHLVEKEKETGKHRQVDKYTKSIQLV